MSNDSEKHKAMVDAADAIEELICEVEVYSTSGVVRAGEIQPVYVSADRDKALAYVRRAAK